MGKLTQKEKIRLNNLLTLIGTSNLANDKAFYNVMNQALWLGINFDTMAERCRLNPVELLRWANFDSAPRQKTRQFVVDFLIQEIQNLVRGAA